MSLTKNKNIFHLIFILLVSVPFFTLAQEYSISAGHQLLQEKKFLEAHAYYTEMIEQGYGGESLFYNLGIANYELEAYPEAILNFEKALKIDPDDKAILHNLRLANSRIDQEFIKVEDFFLSRWWMAFSNLLSLGTWTFLSIALLSILLIIFYLNQFGSNSFIDKWGVRILIPGLMLFVIIVAASKKKYDQLTEDHYGILLEQNGLYSGADTRSESIYELKAGNKIKILDQLNGWLKVELINKETGWIRDQGVGRI